MSKTLPLLQGNITLESALDDDDNMLQVLTYSHERFEYYVYLLKHRVEIENIVSFHLGLKKREMCRISEVKDWRAGSFNVCIPVYVDVDANMGRSCKRVMIRFPLLYKVGEFKCPGNADEKIRSEAATYIWIQENCPTIPIPYLWGFGLSDGMSVCIQVSPISYLISDICAVYDARYDPPLYAFNVLPAADRIIGIWISSSLSIY